MNYKKHYDSLMSKARKRKSLRGYYEVHHILPKSLGGEDTKDNLVKLTAREHFVAHWLLHRMIPDNSKLSFAFKMMATVKTEKQHRYTPSSRAVAEAKKAGVEAMSKSLKGTPKTPEHVQKVANANTGKKRTKEVKAKLSALKKGKPSGRGIKVSQFTLTGDFIRSYSSLKDATIATGVDGTNIRSAINGKYKQSGGFKWKEGLYDESITVKRDIIIEKIKTCSINQLEGVLEVLGIR